MREEQPSFRDELQELFNDIQYIKNLIEEASNALEGIDREFYDVLERYDSNA